MGTMVSFNLARMFMYHKGQKEKAVSFELSIRSVHCILDAFSMDSCFSRFRYRCGALSDTCNLS